MRKELKGIVVGTHRDTRTINLLQEDPQGEMAKITIRPDQVEFLCTWLKEAQQTLAEK